MSALPEVEWMREFTWLYRCCNRRRTVSIRKVSHSSRSSLSAKSRGRAGKADHVHVHAIGPLQIGRGEEMGHDLVQIDAVRARQAEKHLGRHPGTEN